MHYKIDLLDQCQYITFFFQPSIYELIARQRRRDVHRVKSIPLRLSLFLLALNIVQMMKEFDLEFGTWFSISGTIQIRYQLRFVD